MLTARRVVVLTVVAATVVFCGVQDRVTAAAARQYVARQNAALAGRGAIVTIDEVMQPAIRASVRRGLAWGGGIAGLGALCAVAVAQRGRGGRVEKR